MCYMSGSIQMESIYVPENEVGLTQWLFGKSVTSIVLHNTGTTDGFVGIAAPSLARILPVCINTLSSSYCCWFFYFAFDNSNYYLFYASISLLILLLIICFMLLICWSADWSSNVWWRDIVPGTDDWESVCCLFPCVAEDIPSSFFILIPPTQINKTCLFYLLGKPMCCNKIWPFWYCSVARCIPLLN